MKHLIISVVIGVISTSIICAQDQVIFESSTANESVLKVEHFANTGGSSHAIEGISITGRGVRAQSTSNYGVYGSSISSHGIYGVSDTDRGVYGESTSGVGVFGRSFTDFGVEGYSDNHHGAIFRGANNDGFADIILHGGNWFGGSDDGVIMSDPAKEGSDLFLVANDAIIMEIGDSSTQNGTFEVWNKSSADKLLELFESGNMTLKGALTEGSDRNRKEEIIDVNPQLILSKVAHLPILEWQYKGQDRRHIGPMAQDFHTAFGLGEDGTGIANIDANGVAFASIKALYEQNINQRSEIDALKQEITEIKALLKSQIIKTPEN